MTGKPSDTARKRAELWELNVKHALYRKTGDWYHQLQRFPGALLDDEGYVLFQTEEAYRSCPQLRIRQDISVPLGIRQIPGYIRVIKTSGVHGPSASTEKTIIREGNRIDVVQSRPERDPSARAECLKTHGYACVACNLDFQKRYGPIGKEFIHVHHLIPLADGERLVDPIADMRPLCPNCHAMVHQYNPPLPIEALKVLLSQYGA